jgi:hypothetical protein
MIDVRGMANMVSSTVNDNKTVQVFVSTGYTTGAGQRQVPSYADPVTGYAQIQALDSIDLKHIDGLNLQGTIKTIFMYGALAGVVQPQNKGGDLVKFDGNTWLIVKVVEAWPTWTRAVIQYQGPSV